MTQQVNVLDGLNKGSGNGNIDSKMPVKIRLCIKILLVDLPICGLNSVIAHQIFPTVPIHLCFLGNAIAFVLEQKIIQFLENFEYEIPHSKGY